MDFEPYLAAWHQRSERQREQTALAVSRAMTVARHLAHILVERYFATRVLLVGSLARGEFGARSDIDLAVAGVPPGDFFRAGAELEREARGFEVDLIPLESANAFFLQQVSRDGVALP